MEASDNVVALTESLLGLGAEVRQVRKARRLTLKQLASSAGISLSHLSAIERGASNPSMEVLTAVSNALDVTPDWFFARRPGTGPRERAHVVRQQNRRSLNTLYGEGAQELGYADQLLSSSIGGGFYMGLSTYAPFSERPFRPQQAATGEQHGVVLEGELELRIGDEVITLRAGDSYSFDARISHHARNRTERPCRLIWAVSPVVIPQDIRAPAADSEIRDGEGSAR